MTEPSPYDKGVHAGQQDRRITDAEDRLDKINGTIRELVNAVVEWKLSMQQLRSDFNSAAATVVATASALEKAAVQARQTADDKAKAADRRWSPTAKVLTVLGVLAAIAVPFIVLALR